ncbi:GYF domain-containing protein [Pirellulaceae bacterium]|nr:GYF domain-containing protein [Pirellulaceae bacterium]
MTRIKNNRWSITEDVFAARIEFPELRGSFEPQGFFQALVSNFGTESIVIEPGIRAWLVADGQAVGALHEGQHTLKSCLEAFKLWQIKQATIVLSRAEEQDFRIQLSEIPTNDAVLVDLDVSLKVQMKQNGLGSFADSYLGTTPEVSIDEIKRDFTPILSQAVRQAIANIPTIDLTSKETVQIITRNVSEQLRLKLDRYGFEFISVQVANFASEEIQQALINRGNLWNHEQNVQNNVEKLRLRETLRRQHLTDKFNSVETREDYSIFIDQIDKERLLRQEEKDKLLFEFESQQNDRETLRSHLLSLLDEQHRYEFEEAKLNYQSNLDVLVLDKEIELAEKKRDEQSKILSDYLKDRRTKQSAIHEEKLADWHQWRQAKTVKRDERWEDALLQRKLNTLQTELDVEKAERKSRVALIENEMNIRLQHDQFLEEKRRREWEAELDEKEAGSQLQRLEALQRMNSEFEERRRRLDAELETLKEDKQSEHQMKMIQALRGASTEELVALTNTDNAKLLSDMKNNQDLRELSLEAQTKLTEAAKDKGDAVADALREAMTMQQNVVETLANAGSPVAPTAAEPKEPSSPLPPPTPKWFVARDNTSHGPYTLQELESYIKSGNLTELDQVQREGTDSWTTAKLIQELQHCWPSKS